MHAMYFTTLIFHSLPQLLLYPPLLSTLSQLCVFFLIVHWVQVVLSLYSWCRSIHCSIVNQPGPMSLKKTYPPSPRSHPLSVTPQLGIGAFKGPARTMLEQRLSWSSWLLGDHEYRSCPAQELCFTAAAPRPMFAPHNLSPLFSVAPEPFLSWWKGSEISDSFTNPWIL